ncbi:MAG: SDR family oxidoreductase [Pseudomonadaceae bacterium]|nr:SDR family oxidoreductase [Pseudomonadaceae bacterium]
MPHPMDLTGKTALITGGNGGIGLGMAKGLAAAGADICIWGTNPDKNIAAANVLAEFDTKVTTATVDVADENAVNSAFADTLHNHGRVDGCFANAGIGIRGTAFDRMTTAEWEQILSVNLYGVFYTLRAAAGHMKERAAAGDAGGRLVTTASLAAISGQARGEHYASTKGALLAMNKALAVEYARDSITSHTLLPGWIATEMTEQTFANKKFHDNVMPRVPMRRWGTGDDFAGIAIYIMSDLSSYHTAETFLIDGGYANF